MLFKKKIREVDFKYWERKSFMLVIPESSDNNYIDGIVDRVSNTKGFEVISYTPIDLNKPGVIKFVYDDDKYEADIYISKFSIPKTYISKKYYFEEDEIEKISKVSNALSIALKFGDNPRKDYHIQLKLAYAMIPNMIGLIDESAEKLLPSKWVKMNALSDTLVSFNDLYTIQAIYDNNGEIWLHTHGLNRCGVTELEILNSNKSSYNGHHYLIKTFANYCLSKKKDNINPREGSFYIGVLSDRTPIVVTCISWVEALKYYKKIKLGNVLDRKNSHNGFSSVVFVYKNERDENKHIISKVNVYDNLLGNNPIFFVSNEETERMKSLARERFNYVIDNMKDNKVLLKIGLPVSEEYGNFEHIWFRLLDVEDDNFKCSLTQEPYNVEGMHKGDTGYYTLDDITDWIIYIGDDVITPDSVYLLMK